ncbi:glycosyltransferase [Eggerthella lenta]|uniref:glycosyltransferase n=1 Tax=Eggerthella lenta TaxID=84112 RepID=UPI0022DFDD01|nr:glycosyltransferase [Eggerthella lenta]
MRVVQINSFGNLSTGSVMRSEDGRYRDEGCETWMFWGRGVPGRDERAVNFNNKANLRADILSTRLFGRPGFHSKAVTRKLLARLDEIDPDVVHLHNIHGYYVNIEMLFEWLASHRCQVKWTLHDCWAFTGHCAYFTYVKYAQWMSHCAYEEPCCQLSTYPKTFSKRSCATSFEDKKRIFNQVPAERMTLITPSQWLADLVKQSFLSKYPVEVRHNEIDRTVFKPTRSAFREEQGLEGRFVVLGVASTWTERKGLEDFVRLSRELDGECAIVLVGLSKRQIRGLPQGVLGLGRTGSPRELAGIYTTADVFFNPTREDNYPTVNLEAEACGTPVVTYDTGGCRETVRLLGSRVISSFSEAVDAIAEMKGRGLPC